MLSAEHLPNGLTLLQDDRFFKLGQDSVRQRKEPAPCCPPNICQTV